MRKFEPGNVYSTPGVNAKLEDAGFMPVYDCLFKPAYQRRLG